MHIPVSDTFRESISVESGLARSSKTPRPFASPTTLPLRPVISATAPASIDHQLMSVASINS